MKSHVNELGYCSGELSCRLIPTRGGQESILLCVMFWQGAQVFKNIFIEVGILWTNLFFAMGWEEGSFTFSWGLSVALNGRKWIQKDLSLRSIAVFSGALQFCREHDWAPGRKNASLRSRRLGYAGYKNARERGAISSRFLCPSLPADVLWGWFVTHSFLLCGELSGEATSALVPRASPAFIYFSLSTKTAKLSRLEKTSAAWKRFKGITLQPWARWLFLSGLFCVQTHPPRSRFFTEGRGSRGA